ncbi:MAG: 3-methyl-2-oxobutanoate hydroxymethyltransferase [Nitrospinae bacterium]|nr:3-methyl-2-oxobutanoate hydroxymethyltransferase [Nitrospinota bacterium]
MKKVTVTSLREMKSHGQRITALTAYDYPIATLLDAAGIDIVLVGDSLGMAFRGESSTLGVTVEDIAYHTRAVRRGVKRAFLVADMPFLSSHGGLETTLNNVRRLMADGAEGVKIEGATPQLLGAIARLTEAGIPVMGHIGLTPQSVHQLGGYRVQGKDDDAARRIVEQARALEEAGVFAIVLECVPDDLAEKVTKNVTVPTIGIGAGAGCDGQILVITDLLGLGDGTPPKFVKRYADLRGVISDAVAGFAADVRHGAFPDAAHSYGPTPRRLKAL